MKKSNCPVCGERNINKKKEETAGFALEVFFAIDGMRLCVCKKCRAVYGVEMGENKQ